MRLVWGWGDVGLGFGSDRQCVILDTDDHGLTWTHIDSLGLRRTHLDAQGLAWTHSRQAATGWQDGALWRHSPGINASMRDLLLEIKLGGQFIRSHSGPSLL